MILKEKINKNELIWTMVNQLNLFLESHNRLIELAEKKNLTSAQIVAVERYAITRHYYEECWKKTIKGRIILTLICRHLLRKSRATMSE